jgi:two-component system, NarL family, sensor kinase
VRPHGPAPGSDPTAGADRGLHTLAADSHRHDPTAPLAGRSPVLGAGRTAWRRAAWRRAAWRGAAWRRPGAARPRAPEDGSSGRRLAIVQFVLSSVALLGVVATIGAVTLRHLATGEALSDARSVTVAFGRGVLSNQVTPEVLRGDPAALARLDDAVRERVLGHPIVRLKIWTADGRIAYSDARPLIGRRFPLPDDLREALGDDAVRADVSDLSRPENRFERGRGRLVEVYLPLRLASGERVMVEAYHPAGRIDASSRRIWRTFLPVLIGVLLALALAQLPLVWSQARRARAHAHEREELAREAEHALQVERRRIATELHDGIVQDLAGAAYELHAAANLPAGASEGELRGALGRGAAICRSSMTRMRDLLVDLRAVEHRVQDLSGAIEALARPLCDRGVDIAVDVAIARTLPGDAALLVHRAAREILLDVRRRPGLRSVQVHLEDDGRAVTLTVDHDAEPCLDPPRLDSLADSLAARGGGLRVEPTAGGCDRIAATLPAA